MLNRFLVENCTFIQVLGFWCINFFLNSLNVADMFYDLGTIALWLNELVASSLYTICIYALLIQLLFIFCFTTYCNMVVYLILWCYYLFVSVSG